MNLRIQSSDAAPRLASDVALERRAELTQGIPADGKGFEATLVGAIDHASALDKVAAEKVQALAAGATDDIHGTMIAVKEAEISVKLVGSIRNKLLDAFHELWRTNV